MSFTPIAPQSTLNSQTAVIGKPFITVSGTGFDVTGFDNARCDFGPDTAGPGPDGYTVTDGQAEADAYLNSQGHGLCLLMNGATLIISPTSGNYFLTPSALGAAAAGDVSSVTNVDSTLSVAPNTGAVITSLNVAHANTWTAEQTIIPTVPGPAFQVGSAPNFLVDTHTGQVSSTYNLLDDGSTGAAIFAATVTIQYAATLGATQSLLLAYSGATKVLATNASKQLVLDPTNAFGGVLTAHNTLDDGSGSASFAQNVVVGASGDHSPPWALTVGGTATTVSVFGTSYPTKFQTHQEGDDIVVDVGMGRHSNTPSVSPNLYILRSRGTETAKTAVVAGDDLGTLYLFGWDGATYQASFYIDTVVAGTVSSGIVPVTVTFGVTDQTGADNALLVLDGVAKSVSTLNNTLDDGSGRFAAIGSVQPGNGSASGSHVYSGSGVPAISAVSGDYYFRVDGGVGSYLYFYNGSAWVFVI